MPAYMLNLHDRKHEEIYGPGAFFDLDLTGQQAKMISEVQPGQACIAASYENGKSVVVFKRYVLERESERDAEDGARCRVFFGKLVGETRMSKADATKTPLYAPFFNVKGGFKRRSAFLTTGEH